MSVSSPQGSGLVKRTLFTGTALLSVLGALTASRPASAQTFEDKFTGPTLGSEWAPVIPKAGPTITVNNGVTFTIPTGGYDDWKSNRGAPRIELPAPTGDFTFSTHLKSINLPDGSPVTDGFPFHAGIVLAFRESSLGNDAYLWGPNQHSDRANLERTQFGQEIMTGLTVPMWLRVQRVGVKYHFFTRAEGSTDADWAELQQADGTPAVKTYNQPLMNLGLELKKWAGDGLNATYDDAILTTQNGGTLNHFGFVTGTVTATGGDPSLLQVNLVNAAGRIVAQVAPNSAGKYILAATAGTYSLAVAENSLITSPASDLKKTGIVVTAGQTVSTGGDFTVQAGQSFTLPTAWKLIAPVEKTTDAFNAVGSVAYDESAATDVTIPGDTAATVGLNVDFAYRAHFDLPAGMVGKNLILTGFVFDDGIQAAYFNGVNLGSSTEDGNQGGPANSWTFNQTIVIPASLTKATGNVLALVGGQGGGGAGLTGNVPLLQTTSAATGILTGQLLTASGAPYRGTFNLFDSTGKSVATVNSSGPLNGSFNVTGLKPGSYTVDPMVGTFAGATGAATITAGQITTANVTQSGTSIAGTNWKVATVTAGDFAAGAVTYDEMGFTDVTVPKDISTTAGGPIADNTSFAYRVKFDLPAAYVGKDLVLTGFVVDDGTSGVFFNGTNLGSSVESNGLGGPANSWGITQTYVLPANLVKQTGNVLAIFGAQGAGGGGITGGNPVIFPVPAGAGIVTAKVTNAAGTPTLATINLIDSTGKVTFSGSSSGPQYGQFTALVAPGTYTLDDLTVSFSGAPASITVQGGQMTNLGTFTATPYPFIEGTGAGTYDDDFSGSTLNSKWIVGEVGDANSSATTVSGGILDVATASSNIWVNPNDNFTFVHQSVPNGDYAATAQVIAVPAKVDWQVGGLMMRAAQDPFSPMAYNQVTPNYNTQDKNRLTWDADDTDNGSGGAIGSTLMATGSLYVKLRKKGTRVAFFYTTDPTGADPTKTFLSHIFDITGLTGDKLLIGFAQINANYEVAEAGFQYDNFKLTALSTVPPSTCKPGDVNGDTNINVSDAVLALKAAAKIILLTPEQTRAADVVAGGGVNVADAVKILRVAAKLDTLPATCP